MTVGQHVYDPFDASMHIGEYPAEIYRWMRNECPLYRSEEHDFWALSRFADIQAVARDWQTYSSAGPRGIDLDGTGTEVYGNGNFIEIDPPRHDLLRDLVRRFFVPKEIRRLEAILRDEAELRFAPLMAAGGGDIGTELCWPLAFNIVMQILGISAADRPYVERLLLIAGERESGTEEIPAPSLAAAAELREYTTQLLRDGGSLQAGLLGAMASASADGALSVAEAPGIAMLLMFAGIQTPALFAANAAVLLATHPDQREKLHAREVAIDVAVEELVRFESIVQALARTTTAPVRLHGIDLPKGATVVLMYGAANRDERRWDEPDKLDLARSRQRNLAFGEGLHFCVGAVLAKLEARIVLETLLTRAPGYEVDGSIRRTLTWSDWGVLGAPLAW